MFSGEHGSQGNQFQVYKVAENEKLKYIHSSEVYWVKDRLEKDRANCHMIIAAKNAEGRGDINFALSIANEDGYYYKPRIDLELLFNIPKDNVIVTPHLAASTEESEDNCAKMAVKEVMEFLENGNIRNSVNYPNCEMGLRGEYTRITIMHRNVPNMIGQFSTILAEDGINIANMTNKSRNAYAYTMIDVENEVTDEIVEDLKKVKEVLRVRVIA